MKSALIIDQYIEIYRQGGLVALNATLAGMEASHRADILEALEGVGFLIEWRTAVSETDRRDGIVWSGPD
jgi:hypothetical protein